jgi:hypothetical protein
LDILPRQEKPLHRRRSLPRSLDANVLRHSDTFRLTLSAFDQTFYLHLEPNDDLIHPAAHVKYFRAGQLDRIEPLLRESFRVYHGYVLHSDHTEQRLREDAAGGVAWPQRNDGVLGWARIMVHQQGDASMGIQPILEGAFSVNGIIHHIQTRENYLRNRHALDPRISVEDLDSRLVIFRDSDVITQEDHSGSSASPAHSCSHDNLGYNTDVTRNAALQAGLPQPKIPWYDPRQVVDPVDSTDLDARLLKRQSSDVAGNVTSKYVDA